MLTVYVAKTTQFASSAELVRCILRRYYGEENATLEKTPNGKPYLVGVQNPAARYLSITHTDRLCIAAFSNEELGVDAEPIDRQIDLEKATRRLPDCDREQIRSTQDFLRLWTRRESTVKYLGETLASSFARLSFPNGTPVLDGQSSPLVFVEEFWDGHVVCVCKKTHEKIDFIEIV